LKLNRICLCLPRPEYNFRVFSWVSLIYQFLFHSAFPLPHNSLSYLVVFEVMNCNRDSKLTLNVGHKMIRCRTIFMWRKCEQIFDDRRSVIRKIYWCQFHSFTPQFDSTVLLVSCKYFKNLHNLNLITLKFLTRNNRKRSLLL